MSAGSGCTWRVRLSAGNGSGQRVVGTGVLVAAPGFCVLTCADVRDEALSCGVGDVLLGFPGSRSGATVGARIAARGQDSNGLALIMPDHPPPEEVTPAVLHAVDLPGRRVYAFGYPDRHAEGAWGEGRIIGRPGRHADRIDVDGLDPTDGFGGAGVVDESGVVIGILATGTRVGDPGVGAMVPAAAIARAFPALATVTLGNQARTSRLASRDLRRLAAALCAVPVMRDEGSRQLVLNALRPNISGAIPRHRASLMDVYSIVDTCMQYQDGIAELMAVIRSLSGESIPLDAVEHMLVELGA